MVDKILLKNLNRQKAAPGIWMMRQAGRFLPEYRKLRSQAGSFWNLCFTPELATEVTLQPIRRFGFDAAIIFSDILVIPESLGQKVHFLPNHGPQLEAPDWEKFCLQAIDRNIHETLAPVYQAIKMVRKDLSDKTTLIGFSGTPWTIATYMIDLGKSATHQQSYQALEQPEFLKPIMSLLTQAVSSYLLAQIRAGVDVVQLFDSWAGLIPSSVRSQWLIAPLKEIVTTIWEAFPNFPIIYYGRGVSELYPQLIAEIPGLAFSADQYTSPQWLAQEILPYAPVQGNLDPELLIQGGENLNQRVEELLNVFADRGYIFNLGHGILPNTPIDHVRYVVDRVQQLRL